MDLFEGIEEVVLEILINLDVPSIISYVECIPGDENYPIQDSSDKTFSLVARSKLFLDKLVEKYRITPCSTFQEFRMYWLEEHIFDQDISLDYILKNWKAVFTLEKALSQASKREREMTF